MQVEQLILQLVLINTVTVKYDSGHEDPGESLGFGARLWDSEQARVVEGVPAHGVGTRRSLPTQSSCDLVTELSRRSKHTFLLPTSFLSTPPMLENIQTSFLEHFNGGTGLSSSQTQVWRP